MSLLIPSYKTGFARNAAESEYPELWRGLVGMWAPSLGPTGLTLHDWAGKNPGTLTGMDVATDWVVGEKGYALDYDGSNDSVNLGQPVKLQFGTTDAFSISMWVYWSSAATGIDIFFAYANGPGYYVGFSDGVVVTEGVWWDYFPSPTFRRRQTGNNVIQRDTWHHVVISQDTSNSVAGMGIWIDGKSEAVGGTGVSPPSINYAGRTATFGTRTGVGGSFWRGQIGTVSAYNRELTANEIAQMYAGASPLTPKRRSLAKIPISLLLRQSNMNGNLQRLNGGL